VLRSSPVDGFVEAPDAFAAATEQRLAA